MAPLNCPHTEYWTVLRDPIERIVSRSSQCPDVCIGLEDARAALYLYLRFKRDFELQAER